VCAPFGYGKTAKLRHCAGASGAAYFTLGERTSFARFAGDLVNALSGHVPGMRLTLAGAFERALQQSDPAEALVAWFTRHVAGLNCTIVIDDLHHAGDPLVARFVARAIERSPEDLRWIVGTSNLEELPVASWLAHEIAGLPLDENVLRLTSEEAFDIGEKLAPHVSREALMKLLRSSNGIVTDFVFSLRAPEERAEGDDSVLLSFEDAVERLFAALTESEVETVLLTSLVPALTPVMLSRVVGAEGSAIVASLRERAPHFFDDDGLRYQGRFRKYLRKKVRELDPAERSRIVARAGRALEASGEVTHALQLFVEISDEKEVLRLIERHGFASLESERSYFLHDALAALSEDARNSNSSVLAVRAMMASLGGRLDVSEALFQHALSSCDAPQQHMRLRYLYACDVLRRGRLDAIDLLKPDAAFFEAPAEVRVAVMALLGAAYMMSGRADLARKWVERALQASARIQDDALSARVHHQASFVALYGGDPASAKRLALASATLAEKEGAYEIAAGAYSVLYAAAADLDDDVVAAATYLEKIALCGAKCGSVEKQLYGMSGGFEIAAERGNVAVADTLERELEEFDVQYSARPAMESLLPARSLLLAGSGQFEGAYRLLVSSADGQWRADRQALRWSEIALYAAAAGEANEAAAAAITAWKLLRKTEPGEVRALRARLCCTLAFVLLGRTNGARYLLAEVRRTLPADRHRLMSLVIAIEALAARRAGEPNLGSIALTLQELRKREFGGLARVIEALPSERMKPNARPRFRAPVGATA
ncbi:MAG: hypothetical protein GIW95_02010, partial [Candidatus Eremiobacteraeota bacterium]|nr:hypothetical protein [Candidatus Eremiobacteraeota bacterium]